MVNVLAMNAVSHRGNLEHVQFDGYAATSVMDAMKLDGCSVTFSPFLDEWKKWGKKWRLLRLKPAIIKLEQRCVPAWDEPTLGEALSNVGNKQNTRKNYPKQECVKHPICSVRVLVYDGLIARLARSQASNNILVECSCNNYIPKQSHCPPPPMPLLSSSLPSDEAQHVFSSSAFLRPIPLSQQHNVDFDARDEWH